MIVSGWSGSTMVACHQLNRKLYVRTWPKVCSDYNQSYDKAWFNTRNQEKLNTLQTRNIGIISEYGKPNPNPSTRFQNEILERPVWSRSVETLFVMLLLKIAKDQSVEDVERELVITLLQRGKERRYKGFRYDALRQVVW